jgi:hypothetical protein
MLSGATSHTLLAAEVWAKTELVACPQASGRLGCLQVELPRGTPTSRLARYGAMERA